MGGVTKDTHLVAHMVASWGQGRAQWEGSPRILTWLPIWWHHGSRVGPSGRGKSCCQLRGWRIVIHRARGHHWWLLGVHVGRSSWWWNSIRTSLEGFYIERTVNISLGDIPENSRGLGTSL